MITVIIKDQNDALFSRNFAESRSIEDMLIWARNMGIENPTINDLIFAEYTGSSI